MDQLEKQLNEVCKKLDLLIEVIQGDPTDENKPGLIIRLDRLEQAYKNISKFVWVLAGALGTTIGTLLAKTLLNI